MTNKKEDIIRALNDFIEEASGLLDKVSCEDIKANPKLLKLHYGLAALSTCKLLLNGALPLAVFTTKKIRYFEEIEKEVTKCESNSH